MSQDLARYLQELAEEGEKESSGRFSIDFAKARSKLSELLFADPSNYLLKFVQAGVSSGAAPILVQTRRHDLQASFRSEAFRPDQLAHLKDLLYEPTSVSDNEPLHHLLLALHAARALHPDLLVFACRNGQSGAALLLQSESLRLVEIPAGLPGQGNECLLLIRRKPGESWLRRMFYKPRDLAQDTSALAQRCRYSWAPIIMDGRTITPSPFRFQGGAFPILADRFYLSRSPAQELLTFPAYLDRPAMVYDPHGQTQNLDSSGATLLQQWRSYNLPRYVKEGALFEPTAAPSQAVLRQELANILSPIPRDGIVLYRGGYRSFSVNRDTRSQQVLFVPGSEGFTSSIYARSGGLLGKPTAYPAGLAHFVCPTVPAQSASALVLSHHGVLLQPIAVELPLKGVIAVISDRKVRTDLSGLQAIHNDRLKLVVAWVEQECEKLKNELRRLLRMLEPMHLKTRQVQEIAARHDIELNL
jgi:hypothetical protein